MLIERITHEETLETRHLVLWPNKPKDFCKLEKDSEGIHYGGFVDGKIICVASIFIEGERARLRKFATLTEYQHKGYGSLMLNRIIDDLIYIDIKWFWCDARVQVEGFYNRFKMSRAGEVFLKSDVEYIVMERNLRTSL